jgi:predicted nucleic acid-binding protein
MNAERVFFDANMLAYAHDRSAGAKHARAREIVTGAWAACSSPPLRFTM